MLWDALALTALALYELFTRLDAMIGPLKMFVNMAVGEKIPLERAAGYVDWAIFTVPAFMLLCMALGLTALCARRRAGGQWVIALCAAALFAWGLTMRLTALGAWVRYVKLLPLFILCVLSALSLINRLTGRRGGRNAPPRPDTYDKYTRPPRSAA